MALAPNHVSPPPSIIEVLPSSSITETSTSKSSDFLIHQEIQDAASPYVAINDTSAATTGTTQTQTETQSDAEPDASLEIAFLVLGVLLALASVVVAVFFGYKQLSFMRNQSSIGRNDVHNSGSGVDLEMGPVVVTGNASDGVGAATDIADPSSSLSSA
jgi:hypothetical protein